MNDNRLTLGINFKSNNRGTFTLGVGEKVHNIKGIVNILRLVGNLKQLEKAIETGASQDCGYEIQDVHGMEYLLNCKACNGVVELRLWFQGFGFSEQADCWFDWKGGKEQFKAAVNEMIEKAGRYEGFLH